jgi:hypothetical protein
MWTIRLHCIILLSCFSQKIKQTSYDRRNTSHIVVTDYQRVNCWRNSFVILQICSSMCFLFRKGEEQSSACIQQFTHIVYSGHLLELRGSKGSTQWLISGHQHQPTILYPQSRTNPAVIKINFPKNDRESSAGYTTFRRRAHPGGPGDLVVWRRPCFQRLVR